MISAIKVLNLLSTLLFGGVLLLVYSYLPISVDLNVEGLGAVHKQTLFYQLFGAFIVLNILLRVLLQFGFRQVLGVLKAWITALIFIVNFYFALLVGFIWSLEQCHACLSWWVCVPQLSGTNFSYNLGSRTNFFSISKILKVPLIQ